jgi:hypothetical protein
METRAGGVLEQADLLEVRRDSKARGLGSGIVYFLSQPSLFLFLIGLSFSPTIKMCL